jgi:hypothetical protein
MKQPVRVANKREYNANCRPEVIQPVNMFPVFAGFFANVRTTSDLKHGTAGTNNERCAPGCD